jgi:hypothetical protein
MARDHARINLDLWGDDDWLDLTVDAQALYMMLYTSPGLTFCGAGEWNPAKLMQRASDWTVDRIMVAAAELSERLFLLIDIETGEYLLRSWIKHDGLWRTPNMAVTVANARGDLGSRTLRGVIVFEVLKLRTANPDSTSWDRAVVQKMLTQKAIDPAELGPFNPDPNGGAKGGSKGGVNPTANPCGHPGAKGGSKGGPTPAPTPSSNSIRGYVSTEGHLRHDELPPPHCINHPNGTTRACRACGDANALRDAAVKQRDADELEARRQMRLNCRRCEGTCTYEDERGQVCKCDHRDAELADHA